jgi:hypothetical protein
MSYFHINAAKKDWIPAFAGMTLAGNPRTGAHVLLYFFTGTSVSAPQLLQSNDEFAFLGSRHAGSYEVNAYGPFKNALPVFPNESP